MVKLFKLSILLFLISTLYIGIFAQSEKEFNRTLTPLSFTNEALFSSNRFTQLDTVDALKQSQYESLYRVSYTEDELELLGFDYTIENNLYKVYFEPLSFSVIVYDKINDFMVSSRAELQGVNGLRENNTATRNLLNSGLWVSYVRKANVLRSTEVTQSLYTMATASYVTDGSVKEGQDKLSVFELENNAYDTSKVSVRVLSMPQTLEVDVNLKAIGASLKVILSISNEGLHVTVPAENITETSDIFALTKVSVFPYFGSTKEDLSPGYMVIPDGSGALIRFRGMIEDRIRASFYGSDLGLGNTSTTFLSIPIIGIIHDIDKEGLYIRVDSGAELTNLEAAFWSSGSKYNRASFSFQLRPIYRAIINQAGDGRDQIPPNITNKDYAISFVMLANDASYSGIAAHYQNHLLNQNTFAERDNTSLPLLVSILLGDQAPSFLGTSYLSMTSPREAIDIVKEIKNSGVVDLVVELLGWSRDGHMDRAPYRDSNIRGLDDLTSFLEEEGIPYVLKQEYVYATELTRNLFYNRDVAFNYSRLKMTQRVFSLGNAGIEGYYLFPERSLNIASNQQLEHISMPYLGNTLFSYYEDGFYDRIDALTMYKEILSFSDTVMLSQPSLPYLSYVDYYQGMPMMHSNLYFYTDQVPLLPMIFFGVLPYFAPPLNFNALGITNMLQMIDYGMLPHYILTQEKTEVMRETRSNVYFTTAFETFKDDLTVQYNLIYDALSLVSDAKMISREMLLLGVSKVTYSNGVSVIINYTQSSVEVDSLVILPQSVEVIR